MRCRQWPECLLLWALTMVGQDSRCTVLPEFKASPAPRRQLRDSSEHGLEGVVRDVHEVWQRKRSYFLASGLEWTPKYAEGDVGVTGFMLDPSGTRSPSQSCQDLGVIKALWSDFIVQELRLSDGSPVGLGSENSSEAVWDGGRALPPGAGENDRYLKFVLCLLGIDTITGVRKLANYCHSPYSAFRFAGIKDKYGITLQEVTVDTHMVDTKLLLNATSSSSPLFSQIRLSELSWCASHLHSGELKGNRFTICVRNVGADDDTLHAALESLKLHGFINYFGLQRFGSGSVPSIAAGRSLLARNYTEFVQHLFAPTYCSLPRERRAKNAFRAQLQRQETVPQKDVFFHAMRQLPEHCTAERQFLAAFSKGRSLQQAVDCIPFNSMYEQSYTSAVFNEAASFRLHSLGRYPVVGDLVLLASSGGGELGKKVQTVAVVTQADVASKRFDICDVVLPLLSRSRTVVLPENSVRAWLLDRICRDNISTYIRVRRGRDWCRYSSVHPMDTSQGKPPVRLTKEEAMRRERSDASGDVPQDDRSDADMPVCKFRAVVVRAGDVEHAVVRYDKHDDLLYRGSTAIEPDAGSEEEVAGERDHDSSRRPLRGLILRFKLPCSSYATMALRELLGIDTSYRLHYTAFKRLLLRDDGGARRLVFDFAHAKASRRREKRLRRRASARQRSSQQSSAGKSSKQGGGSSGEEEETEERSNGRGRGDLQLNTIFGLTDQG